MSCLVALLWYPNISVGVGQSSFDWNSNCHNLSERHHKNIKICLQSSLVTQSKLEPVFINENRHYKMSTWDLVSHPVSRSPKKKKTLMLHSQYMAKAMCFVLHTYPCWLLSWVMFDNLLSFIAICHKIYPLYVIAIIQLWCPSTFSTPHTPSFTWSFIFLYPLSSNQRGEV